MRVGVSADGHKPPSPRPPRALRVRWTSSRLAVGISLWISLSIVSSSASAQFSGAGWMAAASKGQAFVSSSLPPSGDPAAGLLPPDRDAWANWKMAGLLSLGGIPNRTGVCNPGGLSPIGGGADDTANIQAAINNCATPCTTYVSTQPCVVQLNAGTFILSDTNEVQLNKSVVVRGAGAGVTILDRTNGAVPGTYIGVGPYAIF